jgi:inosine/xanthosine triphosphate pyrophosphatase family protein
MIAACIYFQTAGKPKPWLAAFHCHAVLYVRPGLIGDNLGSIAGEIIQEFHGSNGFGYDQSSGSPGKAKQWLNWTQNERIRSAIEPWPFLLINY